MPSSCLVLIRYLSVFCLIYSINGFCALAEIEATPKTCAVLEAGDSCQLQLKVNYKLDQLQQTCIWVEQREKPEQCFDLIDVTHQLALTLTQDTQILIKNSDNKVLDSITIQVAIYQPVNSRKRRGFNWNLL
ncbi:DUF3019 domain-containing protein [Shewanella sp. AS1]|uniref:DUF3019 domain-containing protein n=1 Tax=Shewanella sp. AS1 TaxID=2907626 RepID=UPI001F2B6E40|nr:DUF3019 domain-containing protein [Shewanella sp. AS1]MCE9677758.1 DUF3019 domain-containing protein [Shewanella sp. AS1]